MKHSNYLNITSEIGKLNRVLLHRPSYELEAITPDTMEELLFDDIPYLKVAQKEHDFFANTLVKNHIEVVYLENLLKDILSNKKIKSEFIQAFIDSNKLYSTHIKKVLSDYYTKLSGDKLINKLFVGIRKDEIKIDEQRKGLVDIIYNNDSLFWIPPLPNLYFTRDPAAVIGKGMNIHYMCKPARRVETLFLAYIHKYHDLFKNVPLWYNNKVEYPIEGGDVLVLSKKVIAIGCGERTSAKGIEQFINTLLKSKQNDFEKALIIRIPKTREFMHLDTVFTMIDYDKFTIHSRAVGKLPIYDVSLKSNNELKVQSIDHLDKALAKALNLPAVKLFKCGGGDVIASGREQWNDGSNTLAISPGVVVVYERNYVTNELLVKNGIKVIEIPSAELSRGRGGPRCMSMPLHRNEI